MHNALCTSERTTEERLQKRGQCSINTQIENNIKESTRDHTKLFAQDICLRGGRLNSAETSVRNTQIVLELTSPYLLLCDPNI